MSRTAEVWGGNIDALAGYRNTIVSDLVDGARSFSINQWSTRQTYIALGNFMTSAALLGVDTCPMESIEPVHSDRVLANSGMWVLGFGLELSLIHKLMTTSGSIFLAGASRGVGYQIARILATQNLPVLALIRDPAAQSNLQALNVETVVGDALNPTDVTNAMNGQIRAIVSTIGGMPQDGQRADFLGNKHLIDAAVKNGVSRFMLVSSIGAGDTKDAIPPTAYAALAPVLADKEKAEQYLIDSGLNYTIVRPGGLKSEPATGNGVLTLDTHVAGSITRSDVASLVCRCLTSDAAQNRVISAFDKNMVYGTAAYREFMV